MEYKDIGSVVKEKLKEAYRPEGIYDKYLNHLNTATIDKVFDNQPERPNPEAIEEPCNFCGTSNLEYPNRKCSRTSICTNQ